MIKRTKKLIMVGFFFFSFVANSEEVVKSSENLDIPYNLTTEGYESDIIIGGNKITILAKKGTDLYTNVDG